MVSLNAAFNEASQYRKIELQDSALEHLQIILNLHLVQGIKTAKALPYASYREQVGRQAERARWSQFQWVGTPGAGKAETLSRDACVSQ